MKDNFSQQAQQYAQFRPLYPEALYYYILEQVPRRQRAWDAGTGNGQAARVLRNYFAEVVATDISLNQLAHAKELAGISYRNEPAGHTSLENGSVDLVTVAQAVHWFGFEKFYAEVRRVAAPGAIIAVWGYSLLRIDPYLDALIDVYHYDTLAPYWDPERRYLDEAYRTIPFPFEEPASIPLFTIEQEWGLPELEGYFSTWSALQKFRTSKHTDPLPALMSQLAAHWPAGTRRKIVFPLHLRLGRIT